jgi:peptidoglycan-N-acetylglucosamine deacetylase
MSRKRKWWYNPLRLVVVMAAVVVTLAATRPVQDLPPPIGIEVNGKVHYVRPSFTFGDALGRYSLEPAHGHLLDVEGFMLERDLYRGAVLLNGERSVSWQLLEDGDAIEVVDGEDHIEPLAQDVVTIPGGRPGNPQFFLGNQPGDQVTTRGKISGKIVSVVFRPQGDAQIPPAVALTFDDGPDPTYTSRILSILRRHRARATFFVVGYLAAQHPDLIRREARNGVVATHTYSHPQTKPFADMFARPMEREMTRGSEVLIEQGITPTLFRPPGGSYDDRVVATAMEQGMRVVLWSVDPQDWREDLKAKQIARRVLRNVGPGSIVLLHDGGGDQSATVKALPKIIKGIRRMGLRFAVIGHKP